MLVLEGVLLVVRGWLEELPPLTSLSLEGDFVSIASVSFLLTWKDASGARLVDFLGLGLFSYALTLATISSACSPVGPTASTYGFQLLLSELGARFANCDDMFPPGWPGSYP